MEQKNGNEIMAGYLSLDRRSVLIVDDEPINRMVIGNILSSDYRVLYANDGLEAMNMLARYGSTLSLVLLDHYMPVMDGSEVLRRMKDSTAYRHIPVIAMTGDPDLELKALKDGAADFLRKPFEAPEIIRMRVANIIRMAEASYIIQEDMYDQLTGLLTMQRFLELVEKADTKDGLKFLFFNISSFKIYNVTYGIENGDRILRETARILRNTFASKYIARFADDHFVICTTEADEIGRISEAHEQVLKLDLSYNLQLKAGVYYAREYGVRPGTACDYAKLACDSIMKDSTRYTCIYTEALSERERLDKYFADHLETAINNQWIKVYYQPIIRTISGQMCGVEALSRWEDPKLGFLEPEVFTDALEKSHLIYKLDTYIIRQVCRELRARLDQGKHCVPVSLNLSRQDFVSFDIYRLLENEVSRYDLSRSLFCVEITESIMASGSFIRESISQFRKAGYKVVLDDFGSGQSSLNVLKEYEFDELKIDMQELTTLSDRTKAILVSAVTMAKKIGIHTVAEGVENEDQYDFLRRIGCEKIQGFLFGRPLPLEEIGQNAEILGVNLEEEEWARYYELAGRENLVSEHAMSLVEEVDEKFAFYFLNQEFRDVLAKAGIGSAKEAEQIINDNSLQSGRLYHKFSEGFTNIGEEKMFNFTDRGYHFSLRAKLLARYEGRSMYLSEMNVIEETTGSHKELFIDHILRESSTMMEMIHVLDPVNDYAETIMEDGEFTALGEKRYDLKTVRNHFMNGFVHPEDQEDFIEYANMDTMEQRIAQAKNGVITKQMRIRHQHDYSYELYLFSLKRLGVPGNKKYLEVVQKIDPKN